MNKSQPEKVRVECFKQHVQRCKSPEAGQSPVYSANCTQAKMSWKVALNEIGGLGQCQAMPGLMDYM